MMDRIFSKICILVLIVGSVVTSELIPTPVDSELNTAEMKTSSTTRISNSGTQQKSIGSNEYADQLNRRFESMLGHRTHNKSKPLTTEEKEWRRRLQNLLDHKDEIKPTVPTPTKMSQSLNKEKISDVGDSWKIRLQNILHNTKGEKSLPNRDNLNNNLKKNSESTAATQMSSTHPESQATNDVVTEMLNFVKKNDLRLSNDDLISFMNYVVDLDMQHKQKLRPRTTQPTTQSPGVTGESIENIPAWGKSLQNLLDNPVETGSTKTFESTTSTTSTRKAEAKTTTSSNIGDGKQKLNNVENISKLLDVLKKSGIKLSDKDLMSLLKNSLSSNVKSSAITTNPTSVDFKTHSIGHISDSGKDLQTAKQKSTLPTVSTLHTSRKTRSITTTSQYQSRENPQTTNDNAQSKYKPEVALSKGARDTDNVEDDSGNNVNNPVVQEPTQPNEIKGDYSKIKTETKQLPELSDALMDETWNELMEEETLVKATREPNPAELVSKMWKKVMEKKTPVKPTSTIQETTEVVDTAEEMWEKIMKEKVFSKPTDTRTTTSNSPLSVEESSTSEQIPPVSKRFKSEEQYVEENKVANNETNNTNLYLTIGFGIASGLLLVILVTILVCLVCQKRRMCCWWKKDIHTTVLNPDGNRWDPQTLRPSRENMNAFLYGIPIPLKDIKPTDNAAIGY